MIPDDLKDDDILDDDFDIDDDFEDDWDDQGDDIQNVADDNIASASASGEKSFLQKFFIPIVIAVAVIFGGIFAVGQGVFSPAPKPEQAPYDETLAAVSDDIADDAEDITSVDDLLGGSTSSDQNDADLSAPAPEEIVKAEAPLTPLPGDSYDEQIELVDLEAELEADNSTLFEDTLELAGDAETIQDNSMQNITAEVLTDTFGDDEGAFLPPSDIERPDIQNDIALLAEESAIQEDTDALSALEVDATAEFNAIKAENTSLLQSNEALEQSVANLMAEVDALKSKLEMMENTANISNAAPKAEPVAEPVAKKPVKPTPAVTATAPSKPRVKAIEWVLRSAQPGKATLAVKGSNDLRTIETGNVVKGLGKIKSIDIENGRWVVRGTQGNVLQ